MQTWYNYFFLFLCMFYFIQFAKLITGVMDNEMSSIIEARHMRSGGLSMKSVNGKLVICEPRDKRDHSQRCVDSIKDWHAWERRKKWYPWTRLLLIIVLAQFVQW